MLEKIIIGIAIGFIIGFFTSENPTKNQLSEATPKATSGIISTIMAIAAIWFIGSSFSYGVIYGLMAIGEIFVGFSIALGIFEDKKKTK